MLPHMGHAFQELRQHQAPGLHGDLVVGQVVSQVSAASELTLEIKNTNAGVT